MLYENTNYPSVDYLNKLRYYLMEYIPNKLPHDVKPKREAMVKDTYGEGFKLQLAAYKIVNDIEISHLLGMNDVIVSVLVEEYAQLRYVLRMIENHLKKMKQYAELKDILDYMNNSFQVKDIGSYLYKDLELLIDEYDIDVDIKDYMKVYKNYEPDEEFLGRLR